MKINADIDLPILAETENLLFEKLKELRVKYGQFRYASFKKVITVFGEC